MVGNGGLITACLSHGVIKYSGFLDTCVRFSFLLLPFRKEINIQIALSYEFSTSVPGGSIRVDRAMKRSLFSMCMVANGC